MELWKSVMDPTRLKVTHLLAICDTGWLHGDSFYDGFSLEWKQGILLIGTVENYPYQMVGRQTGR